jgi:hypothetical protein
VPGRTGQEPVEAAPGSRIVTARLPYLPGAMHFGAHHWPPALQDQTPSLEGQMILVESRTLLEAAVDARQPPPIRCSGQAAAPVGLHLGAPASGALRSGAAAPSARCSGVPATSARGPGGPSAAWRSRQEQRLLFVTWLVPQLWTLRHRFLSFSLLL